MQQSRLGIVKSTNTSILIQPNETVTISGFVRKKTNVDSALTEQTQGASSQIGVCPCIVSLDKDQTYQQVPVRIYNLSAKVITIQPKSDLCELHEVKVLHNNDLVATEEETVTVKQHRVEEQKDKIEEQIHGIKLEGSNLSLEQADQLQTLLLKWKNIFSNGLND